MQCVANLKWIACINNVSIENYMKYILLYIHICLHLFCIHTKRTLLPFLYTRNVHCYPFYTHETYIVTLSIHTKRTLLPFRYTRNRHFSLSIHTKRTLLPFRYTWNEHCYPFYTHETHIVTLSIHTKQTFSPF